jgi:branched-chain amino acid transport system ATP-binding protein
VGIDAAVTPAPSATPMLRVVDMTVAYGPVTALRGVSLEVAAGELVAVLGPNGAGKSTLLKTISGLLAPVSGGVLLNGEEVGGVPAESLVGRGVALVPEGRLVFPRFTVAENLLIGAASRRDRDAIEHDLQRTLRTFPVLADRASQLAGTLSGGEQQQLAIARGLMSRPRLLLLDEPSLGLAPIVVDRVFELIAGLRGEGVTILLVEQNVHRALEVADRAYVLSVGRVILAGSAAELRSTHAELERAYLGIGGT